MTCNYDLFMNFYQNAYEIIVGVEEDAEFYCDLCNVSMTGPNTWKAHTEGKKHRVISERQKKKGMINFIFNCYYLISLISEIVLS